MSKVSTLHPSNYEIRTRALMAAVTAHHGVLRKDGVTPYLMHPVRVAGNAVAIVRSYVGHGLLAEIEAIALCHDVMEDAPHLYLEPFMLPSTVLDVVQLLTRDPKMSKVEAAKQVDGSAIATLVKMCDQADNVASLLELSVDYQHTQDRYDAIQVVLACADRTSFGELWLRDTGAFHLLVNWSWRENAYLRQNTKGS